MLLNSFVLYYLILLNFILLLSENKIVENNQVTFRMNCFDNSEIVRTGYNLGTNKLSLNNLVRTRTDFL